MHDLGPVPREPRVTLIRKIKVPAGSAVMCPVRVGLGDCIVVPGVHLLSDTLLTLYASHLSRQWGLDGCLSDQRL